MASYTISEIVDQIWLRSPRTVDAQVPASSNGSRLDNIAYAVWTYPTRTVEGGTVHSVAITETASATDTSSVLQQSLNTRTENASATDTPSALQQSLNTRTETTSATDTSTTTFITLGTTTENTPSTDTATVTQQSLKSIIENASAIDTSTGEGANLSSIIENASASDIISALQQSLNTRTESVTALDTPSALQQSLNTRTENASATDTPTSTIRFPVARIENASATDTSNFIYFTPAGRLESISAIDTVTVLQQSLNTRVENTSATDTSNANIAWNVTIQENASSNDVSSAIQRSLLSHTENATATDTPVVTKLTTLAVITELSTAIDTSSSTYRTLRTITENASATDTTEGDTENIVFSIENASASHSSTSVLLGRASAQETITASDVVLAIQRTLGLIQESISATDTPTALQRSLNARIESVTALDTPSATQQSLKSITENAPATSSSIANILHSVGRIENGSAISSQTSILFAYGEIEETVSAFDTVSAVANLFAEIQETLTSEDIPSATIVTNAGIVEVAVALDSSTAKKVEIVITTYQSRLSSKLNKIAKKVTNNAIDLAGETTDAILITLNKSTQGDILSRTVEDLEVVNVMFPPMVDIPLRKNITNGVAVLVPYVFETAQSIVVHIPSTKKIDQDDLLIKYYENVYGGDPYICIYQVKDMKGTFGARSIIYMSYQLSFYDGVLPDKIITWILDMCKRRTQYSVGDYQSKLSAKLNNISRKSFDNKVRLTGVATDTIKISLKTNSMGDILSRTVEDLDVINVVFPPMKDMPLKVITTNSISVLAPYAFEEGQALIVTVPSFAKIDQDDLLIKFYENTDGGDPYICIYQVKEMLGTFGGRSLISNKYKLSFYDGVLPDKILSWALEMCNRRSDLNW